MSAGAVDRRSSIASSRWCPSRSSAPTPRSPQRGRVVATTVAILSVYGRQARRRAGTAQHLVRTLAFIAWAFVLSNPLAPAAPVARWLPALAVVLIPLVGAFMFPPASPIEPTRRE